MAKNFEMIEFCLSNKGLGQDIDNIFIELGKLEMDLAELTRLTIKDGDEKDKMETEMWNIIREIFVYEDKLLEEIGNLHKVINNYKATLAG